MTEAQSPRVRRWRVLQKAVRAAFDTALNADRLVMVALQKAELHYAFAAGGVVVGAAAVAAAGDTVETHAEAAVGLLGLHVPADQELAD